MSVVDTSLLSTHLEAVPEQPARSCMPLPPQDVKSADWTDRVKPFWPAVLVSCLKLKSLKVLATSSTVRKGALAILVGCMTSKSAGLKRAFNVLGPFRT